MKQFLAAALVCASFLATAAHADSTQSGSYAIAGSVAGTGVTGSINGQNVGGVSFDANGETPAHVKVTDASGTPVYFTVCQDQDASQLCDATEPSAVGCGEVDLSGFDTVTPVLVFVNTLPDPTFTPTCAGVGTTGVVDLTTTSA